MSTLKDSYRFTNMVPIQGFSDENIMVLREKLNHGKVIDIKTNFWKLVPTPYPGGRFLPPEKHTYEIHYSGIIRFVDLDGLSVIHQRSCHYPSEYQNMGRWLRQKEYGSLSFGTPQAKNPMTIPSLIDQQGANIQIQIHNAVTHCLQEFQKLFPK